MLYGKVGYHDWEGLSVDPDERHRIAERLDRKSCLVMRNHGLLTVGKTAGECFMNMYYLIRMCEVAVQALATQQPLTSTKKEMWELASKQYESFSPGLHEWPALKRQLDKRDPSYRV